MKICYSIQTHKNSEQIYRLVSTLKKLSNCQVIVSHNSSGCDLDLTPLQRLPEVEVLYSKRGRGNFSIIQGYLDIIDWLFKHNIDFDWLINLTGQDYPTQPLSQLENFLAETTHDGFLEHFEVFSEQSHWSIREGSSRYLYKYWHFFRELPEWQKELLNHTKVVNYIQPFFRINFPGTIGIGVRRSSPFNQIFFCYGGSYFCILSKKCIQFLHNFSQDNLDIVNYYKNTYVPSESFIQTALVNSQLFNLSSDYKRYANFHKSRNGYADILTSKDYPSLINDNIYFARKFDIYQDSKILDMLDTRIVNSNSLVPA